MQVNFNVCASLKRVIDSSSLPLDDRPCVIAKVSSHCLGEMRGV